VRRRLRPLVDRIAFVDERRLAWAGRLQAPFRLFTGLDVRRMMDVIRPTLGLLAGRPTEVSLNLAYSGLGRPPPATGRDPARDGCGLIWLSPVVPMRSSDVREFFDLVRPIFARWGARCAATLTTVNARALDCTLPILYNPEGVGTHRRARDLRDEVLAACVKAGFVPYRLGVDTMDVTTTRGDGMAGLLRDVKRALDPDGIIAPGRYVAADGATSARCEPVGEGASSVDPRVDRG
jgi:FAD/FMN-containing dehydrogenase